MPRGVRPAISPTEMASSPGQTSCAATCSYTAAPDHRSSCMQRAARGRAAVNRGTSTCAADSSPGTPAVLKRTQGERLNPFMGASTPTRSPVARGKAGHSLEHTRLRFWMNRPTALRSEARGALAGPPATPPTRCSGLRHTHLGAAKKSAAWQRSMCTPPGARKTLCVDVGGAYSAARRRPSSPSCTARIGRRAIFRHARKQGRVPRLIRCGAKGLVFRDRYRAGDVRTCPAVTPKGDAYGRAFLSAVSSHRISIAFCALGRTWHRT
jgi:hypothetical protein